MTRLAAHNPRARLIPRGLFIAITLPCVLLTAAGCASAPKQLVGNDKSLSRDVEDGRGAYQEGNLVVAEKKYDEALLRAWAIDDPYESGTVAYNLAAILVSQQRYAEASEWLVDSRVELRRANASTGNTWLLSAEIAMAQNCFEDAERFVNYAAMTCPPCHAVDTCCLCGPSAACGNDVPQDCCDVRLSCLEKHHAEDKAEEDCRRGYEARIELARARLAAKQLDLCGAKQHLARASELTSESCDFSLHADRHDVAAAIHDLEAGFMQAGAHRDREVQMLRCIGHYREIPNVLDAAAESYAATERVDLAVDRLIRSARIRYARGELDAAWQRIRQASEFALMQDTQDVEIRLRLTAVKIRDALAAKNKSTEDLASESDDRSDTLAEVFELENSLAPTL
ncbi:hypothetical protein [Stieleria varia]|uniref:Tetratricopeptide repeat protein n=1 Tax=Stieleria varia TaxID=2528005 RepID=A0A5C6AYZ1_9BACT|nr:hypothetical protein [Stieleria varia]TWU04900.1 hypothetical protein Pla52n_29450 [Stieleria varia]